MLQDVKQENELKYRATQDTLAVCSAIHELDKTIETLMEKKKTVWLAQCVNSVAQKMTI